MFGVAHQSRRLGPYARRQGKLAALHASVGALALWAITTTPDVVHACVDDLVDNVARHVAVTASNAYTYIWAQLAVASPATATTRLHHTEGVV